MKLSTVFLGARPKRSLLRRLSHSPKSEVRAIILAASSDGAASLEQAISKGSIPFNALLMTTTLEEICLTGSQKPDGPSVRFVPSFMRRWARADVFDPTLSLGRPSRLLHSSIVFINRKMYRSDEWHPVAEEVVIPLDQIVKKSDLTHPFRFMTNFTNAINHFDGVVLSSPSSIIAFFDPAFTLETCLSYIYSNVAALTDAKA